MGREGEPKKSELKAFDQLAIKLDGAQRHAKYLRKQEYDIRENVKNFAATAGPLGRYLFFFKYSTETRMADLKRASDQLDGRIQRQLRSQLKNKRFKDTPAPFIRWFYATTAFHLTDSSRQFVGAQIRQEVLSTAKGLLLTCETLLDEDNIEREKQGKAQEPTTDRRLLTDLVLQVTKDETNPPVLRELLNNYVNDPQRSVSELQRTEVQR